MVTVYRIRNWNKHFENNRSRQIDHLTWVPMPNHHDGAAFAELLDHPNGAAHYGCWALVVQVASKCDPRGTLVKSNGDPHTAESIARMVRVQPEVMREAFERLVQIGWLEKVDAGERQADVTQTSGERQEGGIEGNGREVNGMETPALTKRRGTEKKALAEPQPAGTDHSDNQKPVLTACHGPKTPPAASTDRYDGSTVWAAWVDLHRARGLADPAKLGPDIGAAAKLARAILPERLTEILAAYLDDDDPFLTKQGAPLRLLQMRLNGYLNHNHVDPNTDAGLSLAMDRFSAGAMAKGNNNQEESDDE